MEYPHRSLQTDEFYSQCINIIENSLLAIQKEVIPIKKYIGDRKKEIIKISAKMNKNFYDELECPRVYYVHMVNELMSIQQACEECLLGLKTDLLTAARDRLQPPSYLSAEEMSRGLEICCEALNQTKDETSCCHTWGNLSRENSEDTLGDVSTSKEFMRTQFDESDLKFKHDVFGLRREMFSLPRKSVNARNGNELEHGNQVRKEVELSLNSTAFMEELKRKEEPRFFYVENELSKLSWLKFLDGCFLHCEIWSEILDVQGNQYGSKWHLVLRPQIEKIAKKRMIPMLHLKPRATFNFLGRIEENGANFVLKKKELISLVGMEAEIPWLRHWRMQFRTSDGKHLAATMIQARWRGFLLRKRKRDSDRLYIAASYLWYSWIALQKRKQLHQRYLQRMLISLQQTRELSLKLSREFASIIKEPHVIIHLPSIGIAFDVRQTFDPKIFRMIQNVASLRICMVRNPKSEVIYILPVRPSEDLLMMYSDFIESMSSSEDVAKRITFLALSQIHTFKNRSMNISRVLHCSEDSLDEIRKRIVGKHSYFLPWFIDECDLRLAGNLEIPLLSPDRKLQRRMLNASTMAEMIDKLGLQQPVCAKNIKDYRTLCTYLANFMVLHTEVCVWLIKLNHGMLNKHFGIFLINHISVPFMLLIRKERKRHDETWTKSPSLREEYLQKLLEHLPNVVSSMTRLSKLYNSWKEFYVQVQKYGCLLQAIPVEKNSKNISVSLFVYGKESKRQPKWIGTADKLHLESEVISTFYYMIPQSSLDIKKLESTVNKFAIGMQNEGYFGYLTIDCFCYIDKYDDKLVVLLQNVRPFYSFLQSYIDWFKFAIGGSYKLEKNHFLADVPIITDNDRQNPSFMLSRKVPKWNETKERYAVVIGQLYHTRFADYRWRQLKDLFERCDIVFDSRKKQGSSMILHDTEVQHFGLLMATSPCMVDTLSMVHSNMVKLHKALSMKSKKHFQTNLLDLIDLFGRLSLDYKNLSVDECLSST